MRSDILVIGIMLLIAGAFFYIYGSNGVQEYQTFAGQAYRTFIDESDYQLYVLMEIGGGIVALLGFMLCIIGIVSRSNEQSSEMKDDKLFCRYCGAKIKEGSLFCENCGKKL